MKSKTEFIKDLANKKLNVIREFNAPKDLVWKAWTVSEILDQWWAPKPFKAETKSMNFVNGGTWLYCMVGPNGENHWAKAVYSNINPIDSFEGNDNFCDENGVINPDFESTHWKYTFTATESGTQVAIEMTFKDQKDIEKIISLGFVEGFTAAHDNLDQYLQAKNRIMNDLKPLNQNRVSTYLNFNGNTEEAFLFYKSVFGGEFSGKGIQRFGDIPAEAGHPPIADNIKKMILHIELPILDNHVIMATDAPQEMGFEIKKGNNMHINLQLASRTETKRLFDALSEKGTIVMPLEDMFFGAYFGECTDQFGINWMFHCTEQKA